MQRFHKLFLRCALLAVLAALALALPALAAQGGLSAFTDVKAYASGRFDDVAPGAWYETAVQAVYDKGIMDGMSATQFVPDGTVTWAQAVTMAARLHAVYNAAAVPEAEGAWYQRYLDYAAAAGLLPASCPAAEDAGTAVIAREDLSLLFRSVLSEDDLPVICDAAVPDLAAAAPAARAAVRDMYASGLFTGKEGGFFCPKDPCTRAEIATTIMRLLYPARRVSSDSRIDPVMATQLGNYKTGGFVAVYGDTSYYLVTENYYDEDNPTYGADHRLRVCSIVARTDAGAVRTVYRLAQPDTDLSGRLYQLSVDSGGMLYVATENDLLRIDPATGKAETLYHSAVALERYIMYDGRFYIYERINNPQNVSSRRYRIGLLDGKALTPLLEDLRYDGSTYTADSLYAFGGKLYYLYGDKSYQLSSGREMAIYSLWAVDLATGENRKVIDRPRGNSFSAGIMAYSGATLWYLENRDGQKDLKRVCLLMPELAETVAPVPAEAAVSYTTMYANGSALYYQSSGASRLWAISQSGVFTPIAQAPTPYYEESAVTKQGILYYPIRYSASFDNSGIQVDLPDGSQTNYYAFLGKPWLTPGADLLPAAYGEKTWPAPALRDDGLAWGNTREYRTERGDYVAEITFTNERTEPLKLWKLAIHLRAEGFSLPDYELGLKTLPAGMSQTYTLVVPVESLGDAAARTDFDLTWNIFTHK